jgi:hypothetical protein
VVGRPLSFRDQFDVEIALNFWEDMATMYNRKLVDQKLIDEYFGEAILDFWKKAESLLLYLQDQSKQKIDVQGVSKHAQGHHGQT